MLEFFRRGLDNIIVKIFLGFLVVSFVFWGISDVYNSSSSDTDAIIVADKSVSMSRFRDELQTEISNFRRIYKQDISDEQLESLGIKSLVIDRLVNELLIEKRNEDLGIIISDKQIKDQLKNNINFQTDGEFDAEKFNNFLRYNRVSERDYIKIIKSQKSKQFIINHLTEGVNLSDILLENTFLMQNQYRDIEIYKYSPKMISSSEINDPSDVDLVGYYKNHSKDYIVEESRQISYIRFNPENININTDITDEKLRQKYEESIDNYSEPAKIEISQYLFDDKEQAEKTYTKIINGGKTSDKKIQWGKVDRDTLSEVSSKEISESLFGNKDISKPFKSELGYHILVVENRFAARIIPFEEIKDSLKKDYISYLKSSKFMANISAIEDLIAENKTIKEISEQINVNPITKVITNNSDAISQLAFATELNEFSNIENDNGSALFVYVNNITPSRIPALDEVRGKVITDWKNDQKLKTLKKWAEDGKKMPEVISEVIKRDHLNLPANMVEEVFNLAIGENTKVYKDKDSFIKAKLVKTISPQEKLKANEIKSEKDILRSNIDNNVENMIISDYLKYLRNVYSVKISNQL